MHGRADGVVAVAGWARDDLIVWPGAASRYDIWQMYVRTSGARFAPWSSMEVR
jgi:hypothetical protein